MRGDVYRMARPRDVVGHEQNGQRYCVIAQADTHALSTVIVCPTSTGAREATFRPMITVRDESTLVMVDQLMAVDLRRLGERVGAVSLADMLTIQKAIASVLGFF